MTMAKREVDNIWTQVRADKDVDDLIFGNEFSAYNQCETCSER